MIAKWLLAVKRAWKRNRPRPRHTYRLNYSYTKKGPGRMHQYGRSFRGAKALAFRMAKQYIQVKKERIPLYMHAFARRRYLSGANAS